MLVVDPIYFKNCMGSAYGFGECHIGEGKVKVKGKIWITQGVYSANDIKLKHLNCLLKY